MDVRSQEAKARRRNSQPKAALGRKRWNIWPRLTLIAVLRMIAWSSEQPMSPSLSSRPLCKLNLMKKTLRSIQILVAVVAGTCAQAEPVDLTGMSCVRMTNFGQNTWEFYGDIAVRRYEEGQGRPQRFVRVGEGAYERYSRSDGEWDAVYYFFDVGDGVQMRIFSRPGLIIRDENPKASWEDGTFPFAAKCMPLWERK